MQDAVRYHYGPEYLKHIMKWHERIVNQYNKSTEALQAQSEIMAWFRQTMIMQYIAFNFSTFLSVDYGNLNIKTLGYMSSSPGTFKSEWKRAHAISDELRHNKYNIDREARELMITLLPDRTGNYVVSSVKVASQHAEKFGMQMHGFSQQFFKTVTFSDGVRSAYQRGKE